MALCMTSMTHVLLAFGRFARGVDNADVKGTTLQHPAISLLSVK
jgi:hypothetical protein